MIPAPKRGTRFAAARASGLRSRRRFLLPAAVLVLGAAGCRRVTGAPAAPLQVMRDFTLRQSVRGVLAWDLQASTAVLHEEAGDAVLAEPRMQFYRDGRVASKLRALSGRVLVDTHDVFLSSSVVVDAIEERAVLHTEALTYSSKRNLFTTDADVQIQRPEGDLQGRGMVAKPDLSELHIFNQKSLVKDGEEGT